MKPNSFDNLHELVASAREAIEVSERLMAQMNARSGMKAAPGPEWAPAFHRLKAAVAQYEVKP